MQLPVHSLADDVATIKRAIDLVGGPVTLVGHSFGGFEITNAAYNNQNVTGLVYVAAFAPDEGESTENFVDVSKFPPGLLVPDSGGFFYLNPEMFHEAFIQDANATEAEILAAVQKPAHQSLIPEKSDPPAWKQLDPQIGKIEVFPAPRGPGPYGISTSNHCFGKLISPVKVMILW